jgi:N-acetylmuramoyl-L-alanine amidase
LVRSGGRNRIAGAIFLHRAFARVSPFFAAAALTFAPALLAPLCQASTAKSSANAAGAADPSATVKRQAASGQFARAEEQRVALNSKPSDKRTLSDYKLVVNTYRRVYLITPHAGEVPDSLLAVAELYTEMGDRFGRSYYQSAVDTYQFLMREYPTSRYCQDAYLRSAKLQRDQLGDTAGAIKTYETFLKKFPRSPHKREAQEARAELALLQNSPPADGAKSAVAKNAESDARGSENERPVPRETAKAEPAKPKSRDAETSAGSAKDEEDENGAPAPATSGHVAQIRRISTRTGTDTTRVTIELEGAVQYASGRIANPDRIFFDLHAAKLTPELAHGKIKTDGEMVSAVRVAQNPSGVVRVVLDVNGVKDYTASLLNGKGLNGKGTPARLVIDLYGSVQAMQTAKANAPPPAAAAVPAAAGTDIAAKDVASAETASDKSKTAAAPSAVKSAKAEAPTPADSLPQPKAKLGTAKSAKSNGKKPELVIPASSPQRTRDGQSTLTRALGLKIGRIVIDAGHGGHDTGTIGPTGLMEKDLCLDIALRLGKIIAQRLPSADVVYTRSDDTFIPLEERTHIANEAKADMFISIHANSSRDPESRGIETYYLNLKGSAEAMEVAARENATDDQGIHELQDLVKQIARTEKIDESKEFAEDVQDSLAKRIQKTARPVKNRGVRKAPFVVLIGADMPSILTEISFLSNPADEKLLKQPEHRQRVAEGIYQGVASYLQNLNSMGVNQSTTPLPSRKETSASIEASGNHN